MGRGLTLILAAALALVLVSVLSGLLGMWIAAQRAEIDDLERAADTLRRIQDATSEPRAADDILDRLRRLAE